MTPTQKYSATCDLISLFGKYALKSHVVAFQVGLDGDGRDERLVIIFNRSKLIPEFMDVLKSVETIDLDWLDMRAEELNQVERFQYMMALLYDYTDGKIRWNMVSEFDDINISSNTSPLSLEEIGAVFYICTANWEIEQDVQLNMV